jgi:hypothetical protein
MDPSISAKSSRRSRHQPPTSEEHDEEPRSTSDEEPVGMSLLEGSHADVERGIQSSRVKELFPLVHLKVDLLIRYTFAVL